MVCPGLNSPTVMYVAEDEISKVVGWYWQKFNNLWNKVLSCAQTPETE